MKSFLIFLCFLFLSPVFGQDCDYEEMAEDQKQITKLQQDFNLLLGYHRPEFELALSADRDYFLIYTLISNEFASEQDSERQSIFMRKFYDRFDQNFEESILLRKKYMILIAQEPPIAINYNEREKKINQFINLRFRRIRLFSLLKEQKFRIEPRCLFNPKKFILFQTGT